MDCWLSPRDPADTSADTRFHPNAHARFQVLFPYFFLCLHYDWFAKRWSKAKYTQFASARQTLISLFIQIVLLLKLLFSACHWWRPKHVFHSKVLCIVDSLLRMLTSRTRVLWKERERANKGVHKYLATSVCRWQSLAFWEFSSPRLNAQTRRRWRKITCFMLWLDVFPYIAWKPFTVIN